MDRADKRPAALPVGVSRSRTTIYCPSVPAVSWDTFEKLKTRGLDARRAGHFAAARVYLLEAARAILDLSKHPDTKPELAEARRRTAERLLELARDCDVGASNRKSQGASRQSEADGSLAIDAAADWLVRERPRARFDDIAGLDEVKEQVRLRMVYPFLHPELAERFDVRTGGGLLLYGPPGTGKTMLARATAGEIDAAFFRVSAAEILSKWVGEAEQNVARLFAAARAEPRAILFIDEIESLLPARRDDSGGGSGVMQRVVPQFLQALDGFEKRVPDTFFFLAATNVPWHLDPAVLRPGRFDEKVYVPLPDLPARLKLLDMHLSHRPVADDVDVADLARRLEGYSGADIKHVCEKAATIPFLRAIARGGGGGGGGIEGDATIHAAIFDDVIAATPPSVSADAVRRFDAWAAR